MKYGHLKQICSFLSSFLIKPPHPPHPLPNDTVHCTVYVTHADGSVVEEEGMGLPAFTGRPLRERGRNKRPNNTTVLASSTCINKTNIVKTKIKRFKINKKDLQSSPWPLKLF